VEETEAKEQALPAVNEVKLSVEVFLERRPVAWLACRIHLYTSATTFIFFCICCFHAGSLCCHLLQEDVGLVEKIAVYNVRESSLEIGFEPLRWLSCHFQAILQNRIRKELNWERSENQLKVLVYIVAVLSNSIANGFQLRHP
jgi:hypothetical protein